MPEAPPSRSLPKSGGCVPCEHLFCLTVGEDGVQGYAEALLCQGEGQITTFLAMTIGYAAGPISLALRLMTACLSRMQFSIYAPECT